MFHALRETTTSKTVEATFLQRSSLLQLINLIDVETQNQVYLPMDDIETTYFSLIGSEVLETRTRIQQKMAERKNPHWFATPGVCSSKEK